MKKLIVATLALLTLTAPGVMAKFEQEAIQIEGQLQTRIESILAKTLPPNSYLVTIKVEMEDRERPLTQATASRRGNNSLLGQNQYVLPGVPGKKEFSTSQEGSDASVTTFSAETLVKKISISILVARDVTAEQMTNMREIITGSIPFNPLRGDEMQIANSNLLQPATPEGKAQVAEGMKDRSFWTGLIDKTNAPMLLVSAALLFIFVLFIAFLFGPMRAFLNRLLAVLPRVGEQAAYTVSNAPNKNGANGNGNGMYPLGSNGNGSHDDEESGTRPFHFIREDQLNKLPILCRGLSPAQTALVLAYLPAGWAGKVLGALEASVQGTIMRELSQAREVPPDIVKELEEHVKNKLPYLVGGEEWIQSVYQVTEPETQKTLLGTLNQQSPALAQVLRRKTFFTEDMGVITAGALRMLLQEVGYPTAALALRDEKADFRDAILRKLPVAIREILQQELDLAANDHAAIVDAKTKLQEVGRRMLVEGKIFLPERK